MLTCAYNPLTIFLISIDKNIAMIILFKRYSVLYVYFKTTVFVTLIYIGLTCIGLTFAFTYIFFCIREQVCLSIFIFRLIYKVSIFYIHICKTFTCYFVLEIKLLIFLFSSFFFQFIYILMV